MAPSVPIASPTPFQAAQSHDPQKPSREASSPVSSPPRPATTSSSEFWDATRWLGNIVVGPQAVSLASALWNRQSPRTSETPTNLLENPAPVAPEPSSQPVEIVEASPLADTDLVLIDPQAQARAQRIYTNIERFVAEIERAKMTTGRISDYTSTLAAELLHEHLNLNAATQQRVFTKCAKRLLELFLYERQTFEPGLNKTLIRFKVQRAMENTAQALKNFGYEYGRPSNLDPGFGLRSMLENSIETSLRYREAIAIKNGWVIGDKSLTPPNLAELKTEERHTWNRLATQLDHTPENPLPPERLTVDVPEYRQQHPYVSTNPKHHVARTGLGELFVDGLTQGMSAGQPGWTAAKAAALAMGDGVAVPIALAPTLVNLTLALNPQNSGTTLAESSATASLNQGAVSTQTISGALPGHGENFPWTTDSEVNLIPPEKIPKTPVFLEVPHSAPSENSVSHVSPGFSQTALGAASTQNAGIRSSNSHVDLIPPEKILPTEVIVSTQQLNSPIPMSLGLRSFVGATSILSFLGAGFQTSEAMDISASGNYGTFTQTVAWTRPVLSLGVGGTALTLAGTRSPGAAKLLGPLGVGLSVVEGIHLLNMAPSNDENLSAEIRNNYAASDRGNAVIMGSSGVLAWGGGAAAGVAGAPALAVAAVGLGVGVGIGSIATHRQDLNHGEAWADSVIEVLEAELQVKRIRDQLIAAGRPYTREPDAQRIEWRLRSPHIDEEAVVALLSKLQTKGLLQQLDWVRDEFLHGLRDACYAGLKREYDATFQFFGPEGAAALLYFANQNPDDPSVREEALAIYKKKAGDSDEAFKAFYQRFEISDESLSIP